MQRCRQHAQGEGAAAAAGQRAAQAFQQVVVVLRVVLSGLALTLAANNCQYEVWCSVWCRIQAAHWRK